ncbi:TetR family transcriptional regulator [Kribbella orskensis]|uniref:TetR family transcriptional regulator n=1 Tax=Kribbella orskensis TaxID=2512216 RepID=A0ABY2BSE8_9ACTN|nr:MULTISPECIES: TetR/AcrR family transcriptional regulator [Kribbella]TCN42844.1 TetR family transcriptional regulator [Kribbella sp. VKM Ac-2500]TCO29800.1 TetR family transcriptional regulator [Kribbella orskensis]
MNQSRWQPISPEKPARPVREPLTRDRIVDAAMELLVDQGYEAVSMRKVAQALNTGPASLYAHVANKKELDQLLVDRAAQGMEFPAEPDPEHWQEQLKDCMRSMLKVMRDYPGVARAAIGQVPLGERAMQSTEKMLAILKAGNVPDQAAAWAVDLIPLYVTATAFEESVQRAWEWTEDDIARFVGELRQFFQSLPAEKFPFTVALAASMTSGANGDERFEFGIQVITAGLASFADPA